MAVAKVIPLNTASDVYSIIKTFIRTLSLNSENTARSYEADIRQFFEVTRGKKIEQLTVDDLHFTYSDVQNYQLYLAQRYASNSVNRKINVLRSLYSKFAANGLSVNPMVFDVPKLREADAESYGTLTWEEAKQMIELAKEERNGEEKSLLIELAVMTSIRLTALLNLTWKDFEQKEGFWVVKVIDKGKSADEKPIRDELYHRLLKLKRHNDDKVFSVSESTANRLVKKLAKKMGIDEERNIVFHSLKKVGINWVLDTTGDIVLASKQGNHKAIQTTYNYYLDRNKDFSKYAGLTMGEKPDLEPLRNVDIDVLIEAIGSLDLNVQYALVNKVKQLQVTNNKNKK